ncbi:MAG: hypothetical protein LN415_04810 [Candidatus Thermoplasmatota archaeon]|nr:hypothetical protein [Candidatus Thermoplasmatota archaeon]
MVSIPEDFFRNREQVRTEIRKCALLGGIIVGLGLLFASLGVVGDALDVSLGLESISWLLLAVFFGLASLGPLMHSVAAKHLYGIESERQERQ